MHEAVDDKVVAFSKRLALTRPASAGSFRGLKFKHILSNLFEIIPTFSSALITRSGLVMSK